MYNADNDGKLAENYPESARNTNVWVQGNMKVSTDSTNATLIKQGKFYPYASQLGAYRCPSDTSRSNNQARARSYSMNGWIGSRYMETGNYISKGYRTFVRENEVANAGPSQLWVLIDEHELSIDDCWFLVTMDDSRPFASYPASRHENSYMLAFADSHVEGYKLRDPKAEVSAQVSPTNPDWIKLKQVTTVQQ
jgi:hypothetical protein